MQAMPVSPFPVSSSKAGHGVIHLDLLLPVTPVLKTCSYQYPLKLLAPKPTELTSHGDQPLRTVVHTVFLLTYGGGLVAGDAIDLRVTLATSTRLILLTQGSTKLFKSPTPDVNTTQHTTFDLGDASALWYLADPVQPFESSVFEQRQTYLIRESHNPNICVCDWVSQGRGARGETWTFHKYVSRNEVWMVMPHGGKKLMLRDNVILDVGAMQGTSIAQRMDGLGVLGTLIIRGNLFDGLGKFFMQEFSHLPQIGGRQWDPPKQLTALERARAHRTALEKEDGLLWTAAAVRGFIIVKFGAREVEGARRWLRTMLQSEGTAEREFGERALLCLK